MFRYVLMELVETERDYVKDLGSIVDVSTESQKKPPRWAADLASFIGIYRYHKFDGVT